MNAPPPSIEANYPLAGLTTIRTGGRADFFARAGSLDGLSELLAWAHKGALEVGVVGSGSNLLVADEGFRGLVIKLEGELATIERAGDRLLCGGGARLPQVAARAAREGLCGVEFGVNIPGTVVGAVRMIANAYGGQRAAVLDWEDVASRAGLDRRLPDDLGFCYRRSNLLYDEIEARA